MRFTRTSTRPRALPRRSSPNTPKARASNWSNRASTSRIAGRIMSMRLMGKAAFVHLQQGGERLQCYNQKGRHRRKKASSCFKLLDLGDHIGVSGYLFSDPH